MLIRPDGFYGRAVCLRVRGMLTLGLSVLVAAAANAATMSVSSAGDLQTALTNAQPGDTIVLAPGATYLGNFTLPNKGGGSFITIETQPSGLPGDGARVGPAQSSGLAKL